MSQQQQLLLCTDLDRTLLPNGAQPESDGARQGFGRFAQLPGVMLAYVSGRDLVLVDEAISRYALPMPTYAITDVGTKIYHQLNGGWSEVMEWAEQIDGDWRGHTHQQLSELLSDIPLLQLQERDKQNQHKLSFYVPLHADHDVLLMQVEQRLIEAGVYASLIWSIDEPADIGLLDLLPRGANKLHAVRFLQQQLGYSDDELIFCGDSGNDLEVMASAIRSVLVANASSEVKEMANAQATAAGHEQTLYIATGALTGMNGNYSAGILEGVCHYSPTYREAIMQLLEQGGR